MAKNRSIILISEGRSYAYLVHSCILVAGIGLLAAYFPIALILIVLPIGLLLATTGIEFDSQKEALRKYTAIFGKRKGIWLPFKHFESAKLVEFQSGKRMLGIRRYGYTSSRTFDIILTMKNGEEYELNDFFNYNKAAECLDIIKSLGLPIENKYAEKTAQLVKQRRNRR